MIEFIVFLLSSTVLVICEIVLAGMSLVLASALLPQHKKHKSIGCAVVIFILVNLLVLSMLYLI